MSCDGEHETARIDGKTAFAELTAELGAETAQALTDGDVATIGALADYAFFDRIGDESAATIEAMFETVDGIYTDQLGVSIELSEIIVSTTDVGEPFSDDRNASKLLGQLSEWRAQNQSRYALTHLITNRRIQNDDGENIAGISYLGSPARAGVCGPRTGASISEWISRPMTALVIAHEIAHNFGAPHDGEIPEPGDTPNPCATEPQNVYLMSPMISNTSINTFSQCSIEQMSRVLAAASCVRPMSELEIVSAIDDSGFGAGRSGGGVSWPIVMMLIVVALVRQRRRR